jgi:nucleoside-diphosphate-sugar epimerase
MPIKALLLGSTGMIGQGVLLECLASPEVTSVLVINRSSCKVTHPKLKEIIHKDVSDLSSLKQELAVCNTCFFCLGISSAGLSESEYYKITFEITTIVAKTLLDINKEFVFCYISGAGTDSSEKGKMMWARVKGKTENTLLAMPFKKAYMFRPGYIQPMKGIKSRTKLYNAMYAVFKPLYFVLKYSDKYVTDTQTLGRAMINAVAKNYSKSILESTDINQLGKG